MSGWRHRIHVLNLRSRGGRVLVHKERADNWDHGHGKVHPQCYLPLQLADPEVWLTLFPDGLLHCYVPSDRVDAVLWVGERVIVDFQVFMGHVPQSI